MVEMSRSPSALDSTPGHAHFLAGWPCWNLPRRAAAPLTAPSMKRLLAVAGLATMLVTAAAVVPGARSHAATSKSVTVHCPSGDTTGFVTPHSVSILVGDSLLWRMTGRVVSDSIVISLKDAQQSWPFAGSPSRGGSSARAAGATTAGTYGYNVRLLCRLPGGGRQSVTIDPDIIIE